MKTYSLTVDASGRSYQRLLGVAAEFTTIAGFAQGSPTCAPSSTAFMAAAAPFLLRKEMVYEYPGAISHFPRRRFLYTYGPGLIEVMLSVSAGIFDWTHPQLLEDFHLLRTDESTVLGTVTSESHAYLRLDDSEAERWLDVWPGSIALQA